MSTPQHPALIGHSLAQARQALLTAPLTGSWSAPQQQQALTLLNQIPLVPPASRPEQRLLVAAVRDLTRTLDPPSGTIVRSSLETLDAVLAEADHA